MRVCAAALLVAVAAVGCSSRPAPSAEPSASTPLATSPPPTATPCVVAGAEMTPARRSAASGEQALLADVRYSTGACPRVVFQFENRTPSYLVEYREPPFAQCASGQVVDTSGWGAGAYLVVHSNDAAGVDTTHPTFRQTYTKSKDIAISSAILRRLHETCDFEATLEWVIGLDARRPYKVSVFSSPPRLVVDVAAATRS